MDPKSWLNKSCAAFFACLALWSFTYIFIQNLDSSKDTAILFDNIGSIGWLSFASFFSMVLSYFYRKGKNIKNKNYLFPYLYSAFIIYL